MITQLYLTLDGKSQRVAEGMARAITNRAVDLLPSRTRLKKRLSVITSSLRITIRISSSEPFNWYPLAREFGMTINIANSNIDRLCYGNAVRLRHNNKIIPFLMSNLRAHEWSSNYCDTAQIIRDSDHKYMTLQYRGNHARAVLILGLANHIVIPDGESIVDIVDKIRIDTK